MTIQSKPSFCAHCIDGPANDRLKATRAGARAVQVGGLGEGRGGFREHVLTSGDHFPCGVARATGGGSGFLAEIVCGMFSDETPVQPGQTTRFSTGHGVVSVSGRLQMVVCDPDEWLVLDAMYGAFQAMASGRPIPAALLERLVYIAQQPMQPDARILLRNDSDYARTPPRVVFLGEWDAAKQRRRTAEPA